MCCRKLKRQSAARERNLAVDVEQLRAKVGLLTQGKQEAVDRLAAAHQDQEQREKQLRQAYEERLREKQRELTACMVKLQVEYLRRILAVFSMMGTEL